MKKRSIGRTMLVLFAVVTVLLGGWWWWGSRKAEPEQTPGTPQNLVNNAKTKAAKMTMQTQSMAITAIEGDKIHIRSTVEITNPLPVAVTLTGLQYAVFAEGTKAAEGRRDKPLRLPPSGKDTVTLPMVVSASVIDKLNDKLQAQGRDSATYRFANTVYTDLPIAGEQQFTVNIDQRMPMVWMPRLKPGDLDVEKFGLKNTGVNMTMQVTNPNSFAIRMKDGRYRMTVDGEQTMTGSMEKVVELPAKATVPVAMHLDMKTGRALKLGWKALVDKKDTKYSLVFDGRVLSNQKLLQNSSIHFTDEGTLDKLMTALKKQGK